MTAMARNPLTATLANVSSSASSVTVFAAAGQNVLGRSVVNDSTAVLYLSFGSGAATSSSYTVKMAAGDYFEFPQPCYIGAVTGIWASANGAARTTQTST